jgi:hypothetical protein
MPENAALLLPGSRVSVTTMALELFTPYLKLGYESPVLSREQRMQIFCSFTHTPLLTMAFDHHAFNAHILIDL